MLASVTITPEITTPSAISPNARQNGIPSRYAAADPVHAPVIGNGIETNTTKAM